MNLRSVSPWELAGSLLILGALPAVAIWYSTRKRPSPIELETARRHMLVQSGRIVDGTFLDVAEVEAEDGRMLTLLLFQYRIGGVDYECSQDISELRDLIDLSMVRSGFPCSVRYQPGNPQNSIVVAEKWSGLRGSVTQTPAVDDLNSLDLSQLGHGRS
jgi:hypothetical protein